MASSLTWSKAHLRAADWGYDIRNLRGQTYLTPSNKEEITEDFIAGNWDIGFEKLNAWRQESGHYNLFRKTYYSTLYFLIILPPECLEQYCSREEKVQIPLYEAIIQRWMRRKEPEESRATLKLLSYGLNKLQSAEVAWLYARIGESSKFSEKHREMADGFNPVITGVRVYLTIAAMSQNFEEMKERIEYAGYQMDPAAILVSNYIFKNRVPDSLGIVNATLKNQSLDFLEELSFTLDIPLRMQSELDSHQLHGDDLLAHQLGIKVSRLKHKDYILENWICRKALVEHPNRSELTWKTAACSEHAEQCDFESSIGTIKPFLDPSWDEKLENIKANCHPFTHTLSDASFTYESLRAWQKKALDVWAEHGRHGIIEAATGSGKSRIGAAAAFEALEEGFAVLVVCPTRVLQQQWIADYFNHIWSYKYNKVYTIGNSEASMSRERMSLIPGTITVAVAASLPQLGDIRSTSYTRVLAIFDEVHNYTGDERRKMLRDDYERRLGLTATLMPPMGRYGLLTNYFGGEPIFRYTFTDAVKDGVISKYHLMFIRIPMEENDFQRYREAYREMTYYKNELLNLMGIVDTPDRFETELSRLKNKNSESGLIAQYEENLKHVDVLLGSTQSKANAIRIIASFVKQRGHTIVFSDFVKTANNVKTIFQNGGIGAVVIDANVAQSDREIAIKRLSRGELQAIISPKALDEGVDIPDLNFGIFAGTERNRLKIIQRLGRVLRIYAGKPMPIIVLPVYIGTDEDPQAPGNDGLQRSNYKDLFDNAIQPIEVIDIGFEDKILKTLNELSMNASRHS